MESFFGRLRALLWGVFEALLLLLAMMAVVIFAWDHVPKHAEAQDRNPSQVAPKPPPNCMP